MLSVSLQYIKIPLHGLSAAPSECALAEGLLIHRVEDIARELHDTLAVEECYGCYLRLSVIRALTLAEIAAPSCVVLSHQILFILGELTLALGYRAEAVTSLSREDPCGTVALTRTAADTSAPMMG